MKSSLVQNVVLKARAVLLAEIAAVEADIEALAKDTASWQKWKAEHPYVPHPKESAGVGPHHVQAEHAIDHQSMTPHQRQDAALALRAQGLTHAAVAAKLGYSSPQAARQASVAAQVRADKATAAAEGTKPEPTKPEEQPKPEEPKSEGTAPATPNTDGAPKPEGEEKPLTGKHRQDKALELRNQGMTYAQVATKLGYTSAQAARQGILSAKSRADANPGAGAGGGGGGTDSGSKPDGAAKPQGAGKQYNLGQTRTRIRKEQNDRAKGLRGTAWAVKLKQSAASEISSRMTVGGLAMIQASTDKFGQEIQVGTFTMNADGTIDSSGSGPASALYDGQNNADGVRPVLEEKTGAMSLLRFASEEDAKKAEASGAPIQLNAYSSGRIMSSAERDARIRERCLKPLIQQWAISSNDSNPKTLAIQELAQKEFGIGRAADWKAQKENPGLAKKIDDEVSKNGAVYQDFIKAQYAATQEALSRAGLKTNDTLTLYRGVRDIATVQKADVGQKLDFEQRPLSSYSYRPLIAKKFSSEYSGGVMEAQVQVKNIFGMPGFGYGCDNEAEVVLVASDETVLTKVQVSGSVVTKGTVLKADPSLDFEVFVNIDDGNVNADWVKATWDLPEVDDLPSLMTSQFVDPDNTKGAEETLTNLMSLPSWKAAPANIKTQALMFLKTGVMPEQAEPLAAKAQPAITKTIYEAAKARVAKELAAVQAEIDLLQKAWDESAHPRGADGRFGSGGGGGDTFEAAASTIGMTSTQRQDAALAMRNEGKTLAHISEKLAFGSPQAARQGIIAAQARVDAAGGTTPAPTQPQPTAQPAATAQPAEQGGPRLPAAVMAQLQSDKDAAQAQYDSLQNQRTAALLSSEKLEQLDAQMLGVTKELGEKVTAAIDAHYESLKPAAPQITNTEEIKTASEKLQRDATDAQINQRYRDLKDKLDAQTIAQLAPKFVADMQKDGRYPQSSFAMVSALDGVYLSSGLLTPPITMSADERDAVAKYVGEKEFQQLQKDNQPLVEEGNKIQDMIKANNEQKAEYGNNVGSTYTELTFNTIGAMRPLAQEGDLRVANIKGATRNQGVSAAKEKAAAEARIATATTRLPADWVDSINSRYSTGLSFVFKPGRGDGEFNSMGRVIVEALAAKPGDKEVGRTVCDSTLLHEITHAAQATQPEIRTLEAAFMRERQGTSKVQQLPGFSSSVTGVKDNFTNAYSGRYYKNVNQFAEVVTTGMEGMVTPRIEGAPLKSEYAATFANDKDYQNFITGMVLVAGR